MPNESIRVTKYGLYILAILLFAAFIRLYDLDRMAFHHDESIHAFYSHVVYKGDLKSYSYNPVYHGPFLYHYGALFFLLFGDNDFVARLPFVSFGLLLFYFIWRLKPYIGKEGVLATMLLVAISPTMTYFSRFARNDIYMATMAMGILVFGLEYLRLRRNRDLVGMTFFLALMYSCKENSYMTGFFLGSFIVFYGIYYFLSYPKEGRKRALYEIFDQRSPFVKVVTIYALYSCFAFSLVWYVVKSWDLPQTFDQHSQNTMNVLHSTWDTFLKNNTWVIPVWIFTVVAVLFSLFILFAWISRWAAPKEEEGTLFEKIARNNVAVVACVLVALGVYALLFTTLGTNKNGMKAGVVDYLMYWMFQQDNPRIAGPASYFIPRLLIYEITALVFSVIAFFVYTFRGLGVVNFITFQIGFWGIVTIYCRYVLSGSGSWQEAFIGSMFVLCIAGVIFIARKLVKAFSFIPSEIEEKESARAQDEKGLSPDGVRVFFIYWSVFSLLIYALLQEKVPWLMVHQALPLLLLAGVFIGDLWRKLKPGTLRTLFAVIFGLFVVYEARTDLILNLYNNDDPRETIVYTQTGHSIVTIMEEIERGAKKLGYEYLPPNPTKVIVALQGEASWPYAWYLRNYRTSPQGMPKKNVPYALVDDEMESQMRAWARGNYTKRLVKHRVWWPAPGQSELPFSSFNKQSEAWKALWDYILYRKVWGSPPGSENILFYARTPLLEPVPKIEGPKGSEEFPKPLRVIKMVGKSGTEEQEFNQPRGIAISPDGNRLYVLDALNGRVQAFDNNLNYIGYFGGPASKNNPKISNGEFTIDEGDGPNGGIDVGPDGTVYVTDTWTRTSWTDSNGNRIEGSGRIIRYKVEENGGEFLPPITRAGNQPFFAPRGLDVAPDGTLYVTDTGHHRIVWFNPDGTFGGFIGGGELQEPVGITVGPDNFIYVCDVGHKRVAAFDRAGRFIKQWMVDPGWVSKNDVDILWIEPYVTVDRQRNVYVSDSTTHTIFRYDWMGQQVAKGGGFGSTPGSLNRPKGIAVDAQGNLYIADSFNHRVVKAKMQ